MDYFIKLIFSRFNTILGIFLLLSSYIKSQDIGSRYQGGIVVGQGIIMHPTPLFTRNVSGYANYNFNINQAINACKSLTTGGYRDWRVPTLNDLEIINRYAQRHSEITGYYPENISIPNVYITSTIYTKNSWTNKQSYRYFYFMISDKASKLLGPQKELNSLESKGHLLPVRYFR